MLSKVPTISQSGALESALINRHQIRLDRLEHFSLLNFLYLVVLGYTGLWRLMAKFSDLILPEIKIQQLFSSEEFPNLGTGQLPLLCFDN